MKNNLVKKFEVLAGNIKTGYCLVYHLISFLSNILTIRLTYKEINILWLGYLFKQITLQFIFMVETIILLII